MNNLFSSRLTDLLEENKISTRQLAKDIGVSATSISDWSTGKIQPVAENIYLVAKHFGVSADFLLGLEDETGSKTY